MVKRKPRAKKAAPKKPQPKKVGRPTAYRPEFVEQVTKLCNLGATDEDLADFFDVSIRTIAGWKVEHPEFLHALKAGKDVADERVERSLYARATGYSHDAVKIFMPAGASKPVYAKYREHAPPDTTAAIFWLKNRRRDEWRDKLDHEHTGKDGAALIPIINVNGKPVSGA